ncbi:MAG: efflux RND transporter permease subunit, partial [Acidobacteriota bacterium]|nr:efflux RND transporter permease subunit [Acidobacteriota bacterium]
LMYMPSTLPGISVTEAQQLLQTQDRIVRQFPEVESVFGKSGRADTSTDPAPFSMMETVIVLKPESQWPKVTRWYSNRPLWFQRIAQRFLPDHLTTEELVNRMNETLQIPGVSNAWTMPIKARLDMLTTGIRTPIGIKIYGANLNEIQRLGAEIEGLLPRVPGTRSAFAERTGGGYFLDFKWNREQIARYGLSIDDVQSVVMNAVGGENVTTTVEGRERYPVNVRYFRDLRSDMDKLRRVLVPAMNGQQQIPVSELASVELAPGPSMIRDENGMLNGYVYVDISGRDVGSYVRNAKELLRSKLRLPPGYTLVWSGQYEAMERVRDRLTVVLPLTLFLNLTLLYWNTKSLARTALVILAVPFSAVGAIWFLHLLGYNMSVGVWVGLIALMGVDAETGVFMLLYLDLAFEQARREGSLTGLSGLQKAIMHGAVKRIRPKVMTVACMFLGLAPIMWSTGAGADVMRRIAAPMIGGIFTSFVLELIVYPAVYEVWKWYSEVKPALSAA